MLAAQADSQRLMLATQAAAQTEMEQLTDEVIYQRDGLEALVEAMKTAQKAEKVNRALRHWSNRKAAAAFEGWAAKAAVARWRRQVLAKARGRWVHGALSAAFQGLQSLVAVRSWRRRVLTRAMKRMQRT